MTIAENQTTITQNKERYFYNLSDFLELSVQITQFITQNIPGNKQATPLLID